MQTDSEAPDGEDDAPHSYSFTILQLAPSLPFQISFRLPFSRNRINIGRESLERLRGRSRRDPGNLDAHVTLAAHLLSGEPVRAAHAAEAAGHLRVALELMPSDAEIGDRVWWKSMTHKFLGDALNRLGERAEARHHWEQAVALDPADPVTFPNSISGTARKMLDEYPP